MKAIGALSVLLVGCLCSQCRDFEDPNSDRAGGASGGGAGITGDESSAGISGGGDSNEGASSTGGATEQGAAGGAAGDLTTAGKAWGGDVDTGEPSYEAPCADYTLFYPTRVRALASAKTFTLDQILLFSVDVVSLALVARWQNDTTPWTRWVCSGMVVDSVNLAAMNLPNGMPELFVTTRQGEMLVMRQSALAWTSLLQFSTPERRPVSAIAVADGPLPAVYVIADGGVFARSKVDGSGYAEYGPWVRLDVSGAKLLASASTSLGHDLFVMREGGELLLLHRQVEASSSSNVQTQEVGHLDPATIDIEVTSSSVGTQLFALDAAGRISINVDPETGGSWEQVRAASAVPRMVAISANVTENNTPVFFGISGTGETYELVGDAWGLLKIE
jgi:hypothetical protein